jgi:DNA-binding transcriptional regulator GbsR (MarR family)
MDIDARSQVLFGRYEALRICAAIGRLAKPEFKTGQLAKVTGISSAQCSKELGKLKQVGLVRSLSRRGDYTRIESGFWSLVDELATEWGHTQ